MSSAATRSKDFYVRFTLAGLRRDVNNCSADTWATRQLPPPQRRGGRPRDRGLAPKATGAGKDVMLQVAGERGQLPPPHKCRGRVTQRMNDKLHRRLHVDTSKSCRSESKPQPLESATFIEKVLETRRLNQNQIEGHGDAEVHGHRSGASRARIEVNIGVVQLGGAGKLSVYGAKRRAYFQIADRRRCARKVEVLWRVCDDDRLAKRFCQSEKRNLGTMPECVCSRNSPESPCHAWLDKPRRAAASEE